MAKPEYDRLAKWLLAKAEMLEQSLLPTLTDTMAVALVSYISDMRDSARQLQSGKIEGVVMGEFEREVLIEFELFKKFTCSPWSSSSSALSRIKKITDERIDALRSGQRITAKEAVAWVNEIAELVRQHRELTAIQNAKWVKCKGCGEPAFVDLGERLVGHSKSVRLIRKAGEPLNCPCLLFQQLTADQFFELHKDEPAIEGPEVEVDYADKSN